MLPVLNCDSLSHHRWLKNESLVQEIVLESDLSISITPSILIGINPNMNCLPL